MPLPFTLGGGLYEPDVIDFARALVKMLPDGYEQDETGLFFVELESWSCALKYLHEQRRRVLGNISPRTTTELIDDWEACFALAADALRETSERQKRLVAAESARGGATADRIATALNAIGLHDPVELVGVTAEQIADNGLDQTSPNLIFQAEPNVSETDYTTQAHRTAIISMLRRMLPARNLGQDGASIAESLATAIATWNDGNSILGRCYLDPSSMGAAITLPPQRVRDYGPRSVVRARDLNAIQDAILARPCDGPSQTVDMTRAYAGQQAIALSFSAANSTTRVIDDSVDWRRRLGRLRIRFSTSDIRPGQASDSSFATSSTLLSAQVYLGEGATAGGGGSSYRITLVSGLTIYARDTDGALCCDNSSGSTRYVVGFLSAGENYTDVGGTGLGGRLATLVDGADFASLPINAALYAKLVARGLQRRASGAAQDAWAGREGDGSRAIVAYVVNHPANHALLLDASIDWRDRIIECTAIAMNPSIWPSLDNINAGPIGADRDAGDDPAYATVDRLFAKQGSVDLTQAITALGYSGVGTASLTAAGCTIDLSSKLRLVPRDDGALLLQRDAEISGTDTYLLFIEATGQLGQRSAPDLWDVLTATNATAVTPAQLNHLQDRSVLGVAPTSKLGPDTFLGSHALGHHYIQPTHDALPLVPERLRHHGIDTPQQRDAVGWIRRYFASDAPNGSPVTLDSSIDWRDRFVRGAFRYSDTIDILPGHSGDTAANSTSLVHPVTTARYTGPGGHATVGGGLDRGYHLVIVADSGTEDTGCCVHVDPDTGALVLRNRSGSDLHVTGWIEASFQLGLRKLSTTGGFGFGFGP